MEGFKVEITETATELTAKERIAIKDTTACVKLDEAVDEADKAGTKLVIDPVNFAVLEVHNEHAKEGNNKDYKNYVLVDKNGTKYVTGSEAFFSSFKNIYDEMKGENEEWAIEVYKSPSKNYTGKGFLTCSII